MLFAVLGVAAGAAQATASVCTVQFCATCPADPTCALCNSGFSLSANTCNDINECATNNGGCDAQVGVCTNTAGSHTCACRSGYSGSGFTCADINECANNNGGCDPLTVCSNSAGSFNCGACPVGYTGSGSIGCSDINECATSHGGCSAQAACNNTAGSHNCVCNSGYSGSGFTCTDVNECATANGGCDPLTTCTNSAGSFGCGACPVGYTGSGSIGCTDVNECATANGGCAAQAACNNTAGSRNCVCNSGYTGTGVTCNDVNECATGNGGCDAQAGMCSNTAGSRTCACNSGYSGDGVTCADVNECATSPCVSGSCSNSVGSFSCACPSGVTGTLCDSNGYVPPDKPTGACEKAVALSVASYVRCLTNCRVTKVTRELSGRPFDEAACRSGTSRIACRTLYDKRIAALINAGTCPACLDQTAQGALGDDALSYVTEMKAAAFCDGTTPLAP